MSFDLPDKLFSALVNHSSYSNISFVIMTDRGSNTSTLNEKIRYLNWPPLRTGLSNIILDGFGFLKCANLRSGHDKHFLRYKRILSLKLNIPVVTFSATNSEKAFSSL